MLMAILCLTPSVAFLLVCLYACIDPEGVEASVDQLMQRWDKHCLLYTSDAADEL